jgi:soluble lytic murein transglycosylase-like protein
VVVVVEDENNESEILHHHAQLTENNSEVDRCQVSNKFPQSILQWCDLITKYSLQNNLDPDLIAALIVQESGGKPLAYSHSGAVGLMQVMPRDGIAKKFMCKNGPCFANRPTIAELQDPEFNIEWGTRFLAGLIKRYANARDPVKEGLKAYGPMDRGYQYADKVIAIYHRLQK